MPLHIDGRSMPPRLRDVQIGVSSELHASELIDILNEDYQSQHLAAAEVPYNSSILSFSLLYCIGSLLLIFLSMYPENPERTRVIVSWTWDMIYSRHCQESNSQPGPSQVCADSTAAMHSDDAILFRIILRYTEQYMWDRERGAGNGGGWERREGWRRYKNFHSGRQSLLRYTSQFLRWISRLDRSIEMSLNNPIGTDTSADGRHCPKCPFPLDSHSRHHSMRVHHSMRARQSMRTRQSVHAIRIRRVISGNQAESCIPFKALEVY